MENKKYHTLGTVPNSNKQGHERSLSWLGTDTSIKSGGVKLVLRAVTQK
jgi:hypothetical protein